MKLQIIIEADENGYKKTCMQDGKVIHFSQHKKTNYGARQTGGKLIEQDIEDDELCTIFDDFSGYEMHRYCDSHEDVA